MVFQRKWVYHTNLKKIDSILNFAIKIKAIPGAQVLVARNGKVVYNECFGFHTYDSLKPVLKHDIYDSALLTKILAAAPIFMNLFESSKFFLKIRWEIFIILLIHVIKVLLLDIFTHQAQLYP